ncbi:ribonuclease Z [Aurantibacillus circumpalustris]|uniref:ribonuclease Z n=1 Tax=Aurantibacillus circumpalustris TaxID=3036359 RepID=UPI00295C32BC|nr:ribonuclease Z [Aurantibacillus circumpalustris]
MTRQTFELLILGSSSASPTSDRNPSAQLLNISERYFLIDCGEATQIQLRRYKAKMQAIDHIFISHLHGDHFFGLPGLLSSMHLLGRKQELTIYCPKELKTIIDTINLAAQTHLSYEIKWMFTNNDGKNLIYEDAKVEVYSFPLKHRIYCTGFLFKEKPLARKIDKYRLEKLNISLADIHALKIGMDVVNLDGELVKNSDATLDPPESRAYAYCSDTIFDKELVKHIRGVDVLYHESTFLDDNLERAKKTYHTTASQAATIAKMADVKQLLLGHFSARYRDLSGFLKEAKPEFENCVLATDGKKIKI